MNISKLTKDELTQYANAFSLVTTHHHAKITYELTRKDNTIQARIADDNYNRNQNDAIKALADLILIIEKLSK